MISGYIFFFLSCPPSPFSIHLVIIIDLLNQWAHSPKTFYTTREGRKRRRSEASRKLQIGLIYYDICTITVVGGLGCIKTHSRSQTKKVFAFPVSKLSDNSWNCKLMQNVQTDKGKISTSNVSMTKFSVHTVLNSFDRSNPSSSGCSICSCDCLVYLFVYSWRNNSTLCSFSRSLVCGKQFEC